VKVEQLSFRVSATSRSHSTPIAPISLPYSMPLAPLCRQTRYQQQGELGTISDLMASKIVGQPHNASPARTCHDYWPGRRRACPTIGFSQAHRQKYLCSDSDSATLKILHRFFVSLCCGARLKRAEVSPLSGLRIFLSRVQTITARFKFSEHDLLSEARRLCRRAFLS